MCVTGGVLGHGERVTDTQFTADEIRTAVEEAAARGTYVTVHAHNAEGIRRAVEAGVQCVEHASEVDEELAATMAERGVWIVPTFATAYVYLNGPNAAGVEHDFSGPIEGLIKGMTESLATARAAGVKVGLGADLTGLNQVNRAQELVLRAELESPEAALISATRANAELCRRPDLGTITVGQRADLVAWGKNPLTDTNLFADRGNIELVLQDGRPVAGARR